MPWSRLTRQVVAKLSWSFIIKKNLFHGLGNQGIFHPFTQRYSFRFPSMSPIALPHQYPPARYTLGLLLHHSCPSLPGVTPHVFRMLLHLWDCNSCVKTGSWVVREQGLTDNANTRAWFPWDFLPAWNQEPFSLFAVTTQIVWQKAGSEAVVGLLLANLSYLASSMALPPTV